jgi:hypothetical protein
MKFNEFLKQALTAESFENLHILLEITPTRRTQILKDPLRILPAEIEKLVLVLNRPSFDAQYLIKQYSCGKNVITLSEAERLTKKGY